MTCLIQLSAERRAMLEAIKDLPATNEDGTPIDYGTAIQDTLDGLDGEFDDKVEAVVAFSKDCQTDAAAIRAQVQIMQTRAQALENKAARLKDYVLHCMQAAGKAKVKTATFSVSHRQTVSAAVDNIDALPAEFRRVKVEPAKRELLAALKAGAVPGAHLETKETLFIR